MSESGGRPQRSEGSGSEGSGGDRQNGRGRTGGSARPPANRSAGNPFSTNPERRPPDRGRPERGRPDRGGRERDLEERDPYGTKSVRSRHDDPPIPDDVQPKDLDRVARTQLKTLSKENADEVARHLAMAARVLDEDPELAHRHATSAARRAGRIAVVRESLAITAYSTGDYALALRELRTYRRISGRDDQVPMMVDSERGLGRPDRALELGRSVPRAALPIDVRVELAIAMSGARLDQGHPDLALAELEILTIDPDRAFSWSPALFDAYATVLEEVGRLEEAHTWFERADRARAALGAADDDSVEVVEIIEEELDDDGSVVPPPAPDQS